MPRRGQTQEKRTPEQIAEHRRQVERLTRRGWTQTRIAEHLGISREKVAADLAVIGSAWEREAAARQHRTAHYFGRSLATLNEIEAEALEAWDRSKADAVRTRTEQNDDTATEVGAGGEDGGHLASAPKVIVHGRRKAVIERRGRDGSVDYLGTAIKAIELRAKLLGFIGTGTGQGEDPAVFGEGPTLTIPLSVLAGRAAQVDAVQRQLAELRAGRREVIDVTAEVVE